MPGALAILIFILPALEPGERFGKVLGKDMLQIMAIINSHLTVNIFFVEIIFLLNNVWVCLIIH